MYFIKKSCKNPRWCIWESYPSILVRKRKFLGCYSGRGIVQKKTWKNRLYIIFFFFYPDPWTAWKAFCWPSLFFIFSCFSPFTFEFSSFIEWVMIASSFPKALWVNNGIWLSSSDAFLDNKTQGWNQTKMDRDWVIRDGPRLCSHWMEC